MNIGENIKKFRELKGLSRKDLASNLDINISTIGRYESGVREPNIEMIKEISNALKMDSNILINGIEDDIYTRDDVFKLFSKLYIGYDIKDFLIKINCFTPDGSEKTIEAFLEGSCSSFVPYATLGCYLSLKDNQIYNWILTDTYHVNSEPEDWYLLLGLTRSDFKYIIDHNLLEHEPIEKLINSGLSKKNYDILLKYCENNDINTFKSLTLPKYIDNNNRVKIDIPDGFMTKPNIITPGLAYESIVNLLLYVNQGNNLPSIDNHTFEKLLEKICDLLEFELFKIKKNK